MTGGENPSVWFRSCLLLFSGGMCIGLVLNLSRALSKQLLASSWIFNYTRYVI